MRPVPSALRRSVFHWAVGALAGLALAPAAFAQAPAYPSKPITIVVGYPPGGSTDLMGRMVGTELSNRLGQPVLIENIGGAGSEYHYLMITFETPQVTIPRQSRGHSGCEPLKAAVRGR